MPRLSVIVPVYNVEAFLPACIDSVLNQTLRDLELILIDDGSPDQSGSICDAYAARDGRIKVIHQTNHGVSHARNAGLRIASGDYLGFVDPDDLAAPEMYAEMIQAAERTACDIAVCGFAYCDEDGHFLRQEPVPAGVYDREALVQSIYGMPNLLHGSMCNKVFSRAVADGLLFDESVAIGEDWLLLFACYLRSRGAAAVADCYYTVRVRRGSATRRVSAELYLKKLAAYHRLYEQSKSQSRGVQRKAAAKILDTYELNKNAIMRDDYDRAALKHINRTMRSIAFREALRGNLPVKKAVYYFKKGMQI